MIIKHKALKVNNQKEIEGFLIKENSQYFIFTENLEKFLVEEESIKPIINKNENNIFWVNDILFSENLTSEESSKFLWLLKKAQGKLKEN